MQELKVLAVHRPCGEVEQVVCDRVVRVHEGLRKTYSGMARGRRVVVKRFMDRLASQRCRRERDALEQLAARGIPVPRLVATGSLPQGHWCLITEALADAVGINHYVRQPHPQQALQPVLEACVQCLATMHHQGVLQMDLHLGNFLLSQGRVYAIDPGEMRFCRKPVSASRGLTHLAVLMARFPPQTPEQVSFLARAYCQKRQLAWSQDLGQDMARRVESAIAANVRRFSPKVLRANRRTVVVRSRGLTAIFARRLSDRAQANAWVDQWPAMRSQLHGSAASEPSPIEWTWQGRRYHVWIHETPGFMAALMQGVMPRRWPGLARFVPGRQQWLDGWERFWRQRAAQPPVALIEEHARWRLVRVYFVEQAP